MAFCPYARPSVAVGSIWESPFNGCSSVVPLTVRPQLRPSRLFNGFKPQPPLGTPIPRLSSGMASASVVSGLLTSCSADPLPLLAAHLFVALHSLQMAMLTPTDPLPVVFIINGYSCKFLKGVKKIIEFAFFGNGYGLFEGSTVGDNYHHQVMQICGKCNARHKTVEAPAARIVTL